jgi:hypothetical protein
MVTREESSRRAQEGSRAKQRKGTRASRARTAEVAGGEWRREEGGEG